MPLLDQHGREITTKPVRRRPLRRPKRVKPQRRVPANLNPGQHLPVQVSLRARHHINGEPYGPGVVSVSRKLANALMEQEQRAIKADANFSGTRACIIGPGRTKGALSTREVAPEFFDSGLNSALPFGVADKSGNWQ